MSSAAHRNSKCILKKHERQKLVYDTSSNNYLRNGPSGKEDPEMEKLLSSDVSAASSFEYSPARNVSTIKKVTSSNDASKIG